MPEPILTAGNQVEWLHVAAAGRAFVISTRKGVVARAGTTSVSVRDEAGRCLRLPVADLVSVPAEAAEKRD